MQRALLKAAAKKQKFHNQNDPDESDDDSDASLSSEDEEDVSKDMIGKIYLNVQYMKCAPLHTMLESKNSSIDVC